jgi:hypothetical protein
LITVRSPGPFIGSIAEEVAATSTPVEDAIIVAGE